MRHLLPIALVVLGTLLGAVVFEQVDRRVFDIDFDEKFFAAVNDSLLEENGQWKPNVGSGSMSLHRKVEYDDLIITVHAVTYLASQLDAELLPPEGTIADPRFWRPMKTAPSSELLQDAIQSSSRFLILESIDRSSKMIILYWFDVGGRQAGSRSRAKMYGLLNFFTFRQDSSVIVLSTKCGVSCDERASSLLSLASKLFLDADGNYRSMIREAQTR